MHIRAQRVVFDKEEKTLHAESVGEGSLLCEGATFTMLADSVFFDLKQGKGNALNVRFHSGNKFISAKKASLFSQSQWIFDRVQYTGCDSPSPHWSFTANTAFLKDNSLRAKNIFFRIKNIPIFWVPGIIVPSSYKEKSHDDVSSGFLMPRLYWDKSLGFGATQEYYLNLDRHFDSLFGISVRQKKGYLTYNRTRHALSSQTLLRYTLDLHTKEMHLLKTITKL